MLLAQVAPHLLLLPLRALLQRILAASRGANATALSGSGMLSPMIASILGRRGTITFWYAMASPSGKASRGRALCPSLSSEIGRAHV